MIEAVLKKYFESLPHSILAFRHLGITSQSTFCKQLRSRIPLIKEKKRYFSVVDQERKSEICLLINKNC